MTYPTYVYVDAFNVYYGCTKGTPYRWLNLAELCDVMLTNNVVERIKVFTAKSKPRPHDPGSPQRQQIYLRALRTIPNLEVIYGSFITRPRWYPKFEKDPSHKREYVQVEYTEEKGSDVNLASHLLYDAFEDRYEMAVIMSNDSDLAEPIRIAKVLLKKKVGILNPQINKPQYKDEQGNIDYRRIRTVRPLRDYANFCKPITIEALAASQFPDELTDEKGTFRKPSSW